MKSHDAFLDWINAEFSMKRYKLKATETNSVSRKEVKL